MGSVCGSGARPFNFFNSLFFAPESFEEPTRVSHGGSIYAGRAELLVIAAMIYVCWYQRKKCSRKLDTKIRPAFRTSNRYEVLKYEGDTCLPYQKL